jgi:hypothetical protein
LRQIGQSIGSAGFGAIFNIGIYSRIPDAGTAVAALMDPVKRALLAPADVAREASAIAFSLHGVYLILLALAVVEFGLILALPRHLRPEYGPAPSAPGVRSA